MDYGFRYPILKNKVLAITSKITNFYNTCWKLEMFDKIKDFLGGSDSKESACNAGDLGHEDLLNKEMATHSSILAQTIPWTEEPGGYNPWGCKEVDMTEAITLHFT